MLGILTLPGGIVAEMNDDGIWSSDDEVSEQYLNLHFSPSDHPRLSLPFGVNALVAAMAAIGGEVTLTDEVPPLEEGELY